MEQPAAVDHGCCDRRGCHREGVRRHAASAHTAAGLQRRSDVDGPVQDGKRACRCSLEHDPSLRRRVSQLPRTGVCIRRTQCFAWTVISRHSPYLRTAPAATAPARLAESSGGEAWWRPAPRGGVEIATLHEGELRRHQVDDDGTLTLVEALAPTQLQRRGPRIALAGWFVGLVMMVIGGIAAGGKVAILGWTIAVVAMWFGGKAFSRASDVGDRLSFVKDTKRGWTVAPVLSGWQPPTTAQLQAVEELADANEGVAYVRDDGGRTVEVLVRHRFAFRRLWVDRDGNSGLASTAPAGLWPLSRHVGRLEQRGETWLLVKTAEPPED
jgi:hypothetical protein